MMEAHAMEERRAFARVQLTGPSSALALDPRSDNRARLVDVSCGGALVESHARVMPGASVELLVLAHERPVVLRGAVARCQVAELHPRLGPCYRAGVLFEHPLDPDEVAVLREAPAARLHPC
jgi:hypothetical protein